MKFLKNMPLWLCCGTLIGLSWPVFEGVNLSFLAWFAFVPLFVFLEKNRHSCYTFKEDGEVQIVDDLVTTCPVPIEWAMDFDPGVTYFYDQPYELDSTEFYQDYKVVAFGQLNTYDDGPVDALKMHYTEKEIDYKDGIAVETTTENQIVWYSVKGHYIRGLLKVGAPFIGQTTFREIMYQKDNKSCIPAININYQGIQVGNYKAGNQLTSKAIISDETGEDVTFAAGQEIVLLPGFHAVAESSFTAKIEGCATSAFAPDSIPREKKVRPEPKIEKILPLAQFEVNINDLGQAALSFSSADNESILPLSIEKSADGLHFTTIGNSSKSGDSPTEIHHFLDENPTKSTNYYRLRQADNQGNTIYSKVISALVADNSADQPVVVLYPNPGKDQVWFSQTADYELFDLHERLLTKGHANDAVDVSMFVAGQYYVRINGAEMHAWVKQ